MQRGDTCNPRRRSISSCSSAPWLLEAQFWILGVGQDIQLRRVVCWDSLFHLARHHFKPVIGNIHRWLKPGGRMMVSSGGVVEDAGSGFTDTMFGHEFFYDSLSPDQMVGTVEEAEFGILVAEMYDQPDGGRNKGKWAIIAARKA